MRPPVISPTVNRKILLDEIRKVQPRGGTAYLDAVAKGIDILKASGKHDERALVIMTDGIDLNSVASLERVVAQAKKNQVHVYTIGIGEPGRLDPVNSVLVLDHSRKHASRRPMTPMPPRRSKPFTRRLHVS